MLERFIAVLPLSQAARAAAFVALSIAAGLFVGAGVSQIVRAQPIEAAGKANVAAAEDVKDWLSRTESLRADFTQQSAGGQFVRGTLTLRQPGQARFEYEPSVEMLIVANKGSLYFIDYEVSQLSRYPIRETPLAPLLNPDALDALPLKAVEITDGPRAGMIAVTSEDPKHREYGTLTMIFERTTPESVALRSWSVLDGQGNLTQITLNNIEENIEIADSAFSFRDPRRKAPRGRRSQ